MKVLCSCGAKYEFELTPSMTTSPVKFVCPACRLDASEFVDGLIRRELGQSHTPAGVPVPIFADGPAAATPPPPRPAVVARVHAPPPPAQDEPAPEPSTDAVPCLKHPGQVATEKCRVCSKPICPKCMELFGYVCSPLCKARADSHGLHIPIYSGQKSVVEARLWRKVVLASSAIALLLVGGFGFWIWFSLWGSAPRPIFSVRFPDPAYSGQSIICGKNHDQIVFLHGATLARYDLKGKKEIWSHELVDKSKIDAAIDQELEEMKAIIAKKNSEDPDHVPAMPSREKMAKSMARAEASGLQLHVRGQNIWLASPGKLVRYDWDTGKPDKEIAVQSGFGGIVARGDELLVVDSESGKPIVTHINLNTCDSRTEDLTGPEVAALAGKASSAASSAGKPPPGAIAAKLARGPSAAGLPVVAGKDAGKPLDPSKVAAQAQRLSLPARIALPATLSSTMSQQRTLDAINDDSRHAASDDPDAPEARSSFSVIPAGDSFLEFGAQLLERRMTSHSAMKAAPKKSALDNLSGANSMDAANEVLNEMQRSRGGDVVTEDISRYQVTVRKPGSDESWTGEVIGPPKLFPLQTVNVVTGNKQIVVLDKSNKKLWQNTLSYNVVGGLGALDEGVSNTGQGPCVEQKGTLYVFDEGVLSAFDLKTGNARWRLPSVGISGIFFDDHDMLYVNSTTADPDSIKYSRQIDISQKTGSIVLKVDSRNGKVLWTSDTLGTVNYVSGKYIFTVDASMVEEENDSPYQVDTGFETPQHLRIRRINPRNGHEMWEHYQERAPIDIGFDKNTIRLVFKKEVQVLKFFSF